MNRKAPLSGLERVMRWFAEQHRAPFDFQRRTWDEYLAGRSGLILAPTGVGKTLAAALGPMIESMRPGGFAQPSGTGFPSLAAPLAGRDRGTETVAAPATSPLCNLPPSPATPGQGRAEGDVEDSVSSNSEIALTPTPALSRGTGRGGKRQSQRASAKTEPITIIWITPLRALAADTVGALQQAVDALDLRWSVELRTSDTTATLRRRQKERLPTILVTTPESASLLLSYEDSPSRFETLRCAIVDEWHELIGSKRGVQTELALARFRALAPSMRTWGLSATIANADEALSALVGPAAKGQATSITAPDTKPIVVESLLPERIERFPWAGHLGTRMVEPVIQRIESAESTLVFTNTRSHSELWFRALLQARPDWLGKIALHHGSLDRKLRSSVEQMLRAGELRAVVCTSSLDLGVDFFPVDQVIQIGSPKNIARAIQRAGRSGHRPGATSRLVCVPTQAFEMVEFSAVRRAVDRRAVELREPVTLALDVLAQHVVTVAAGGGFDEAQLLAEVRTTHAFAALTDQHWQWVMDFAKRGGASLAAYPRFARIVEENGRWAAASPQISRMHRMNIGTITADGAVNVQFVRGKYLGSVEESFASKLRPGDLFNFAGRTLQTVRMHEMTLQVKPSKSKRGFVPKWMGGKMAMSGSLAESVRVRLDEASESRYLDAEMQHIRPILQLQQRWSIIPRHGQLLIESVTTREGHHHFLYPFQGRLVHEGLSALMTYRFARRGLSPITATFNDYGIELLSQAALANDEAGWREVLSPENLLADVSECVNTGESARRHFREIARIAGLLVPTRPGAPRSVRALQASSELFYDVFKEFDPENLLLVQARLEVLTRQLEFTRLQAALLQLADEQLILVSPARVTPMAFPLFAESIASQQLRSENASQRIERLAAQLEAAAMAQDECNDLPVSAPIESPAAP